MPFYNKSVAIAKMIWCCHKFRLFSYTAALTATEKAYRLYF